MVQKYFCFFLLLFISIFSTNNQLNAQELAQISGKITDDQSQKKLQGVLLLLNGFYIQSTDGKGFFEFSGLKSGEYNLKIQVQSYQEKDLKVQLMPGQKLTLNIALRPLIRKDHEVIISGSRVKETLDEVTSSVSIIGKHKLAQQQAMANNMADVLSEVPGMAMSSGSLKNDTQSLRGRTPLVLIDGIPQSTPLRNMFRDINAVDMNALERIEVIKGATAIYGNGSDGGIINFTTKKPDKGKAFSSLTRLIQTGALSGFKNALGGGLYQQFSGKPGRWDYVISGLYESTGVFYDAKSRVVSPFYGMGESRTYGAFGKFGYDISANERIEWMLNYYRSLQHTQYISTGDGRYGIHPETGIFGQEKGSAQGVPYNFNSQLKYSFQGIFAATNLDVSLYVHKFNAVAYYNEKFIQPSTGKIGGQSQVLASKKGLRFNLDTPFSFSDAIRGKLFYGLDILNDKTRQNLLDGRDWVPELSMWNYAPYVQLKLHILKDWIVKGGLRFDNIRIYVPNYTTLHMLDKNKNIVGGVSVKGGNLSYNSTVFNLGLRYNRFKVFKPFLSFSQSFSIAQLGRELRGVKPGKGATLVSSLRPKAVIANNYELGFDSRLDEFFHLSGSVFLSTSELGAQLKSVDGIYKVSRAPERIYGYEAQADFFPFKRWRTGVSLAYIQGQIDGNNNGRYSDSRNTFINSLRIPPLKINSYIEYDDKKNFQVRLSGLFSASRKLFSPGEGGRYKEGEGPISAITLINVSATYRFTPQLRLNMGIQNLFNKEYYSQSSMMLGRDNRYIQGSGARYRLALSYIF